MRCASPGRQSGASQADGKSPQDFIQNLLHLRGIEFLKNKTVLFTNILFLPKRILYFRCFGKTAESSSLGPKTPKCCNPKPLAVTKTCLQVETFWCGASHAVLFGCVFACLLGAKGFPPRLPRTGELGSALLGLLASGHLCPLQTPEQFEKGKKSQLGEA